jgi:hypothetical protein
MCLTGRGRRRRIIQSHPRSYERKKGGRIIKVKRKEFVKVL